MITARIFAVLSALCLVAAFALATLLVPTPSLGELISEGDHALLVHAQDAVRARVAWLWDGVAVPLLMRPCWLVPASLGIVFGGAALSAGSRRGPSRSRRRRS